MKFNMNMSTLPKIAVVLAVQLLIIASVVAFKQYTVWTGETVRLAVGPVDPRDPFRGDYVTLTYEISRIDPDDLIGQRYAYDTVYVELREGDDGIWDAVAIHDDRRREFEDTVLLKGKSEYWSGDTISVRYGIEELFIPEGSGRDIPWQRRDEISVEIKVDRFGNAVLRHLLVDGEQLDLERR
jgi:uncharacterized membrane-anchored protein